MKNLYTGLKSRIESQATIFKLVSMWNNQADDITEGKIQLFQMPAVFIEFVNENPVDSVGGGVQLYDPLDIKFHILHNFYDAQDGTMEVNLEIFEVEQALHSAIQLYKVSGTDYGSGPISRVSNERDTNHTNLYHSIVTYRTSWTDNSMSQPVGGIVLDPPLTLNLTPTVIPTITP